MNWMVIKCLKSEMSCQIRLDRLSDGMEMHKGSKKVKGKKKFDF
jgi:hypothetical protein